MVATMSVCELEPMNTHGLTDDQRDIRALAARFADEVVAPQAMQWDRSTTSPRRSSSSSASSG